MFNLELPTDQTHYVHRAGRTGRMGAAGFVLSIAEPKEKFVLVGRQMGVDIVAADLQKARPTAAIGRGCRGDSATATGRRGERTKRGPREGVEGRGGGRGRGGRGGQHGYTPRGSRGDA